MKKVILSVIGLGIALALVLAIWVPIANNGRTTAGTTLNRANTINTHISSIEAEVK